MVVERGLGAAFVKGGLVLAWQPGWRAGDRAADMRERAQRRVRLQGPGPQRGRLGQLGGHQGANNNSWGLLTARDQQLKSSGGRRAAS